MGETSQEQMDLERIFQEVDFHTHAGDSAAGIYQSEKQIPIEFGGVLCGSVCPPDIVESLVNLGNSLHFVDRMRFLGKGGFGAMLRIQAKQKGAKKTTDFGACRDLSGRRLRHINDELILNKWKAARDSGKEFDVEQVQKMLPN